MDKIIQRKIDIMYQKIREINAVYHKVALEAGISDGELSIWMIILQSEEEYSQQDLCEILCLSKQTINSIITKLVKKGLLFLEHVSGTRNQKVIRLTEEGKAYGEQKVLWLFEAEQRALEYTDPEQIEACIRMLEQYIVHFKKELNIEAL